MGRRLSIQKQCSLKIIYKFLKFGAAPSAKTSISPFVRFDAVLADAVYSLACYIVSAQSTGCDSRRELCMAGESSITLKTNRGGRIPQESMKRMKEMHPIVASNLLSFCFKSFCVHCPLASDSESIEKFHGNTGSDMDKMENKNR